MAKWIILSTPYYHFGIAVLAAVVAMWLSVTRQIARQERILAAIARHVSKERYGTETVHGRRNNVVPIYEGDSA